MEKIDFDESSPLQVYAHRWLEKEGFFDEDAPYDGMLGEAVFELINNEEISQLADAILRLEYPTYENAIYPMQNAFKRLKIQIELTLRSWLIMHNLLEVMEDKEIGGK